MVNKHAAVVVAAFLLLIFSASTIGTALAQDRVYYFGHEYAKIWINQDGTIDLMYDRSLTLESGQQITWVEIGQPKRDFTIGSAEDQYGHILKTEDTSSGSNYKVRVTFDTPLQAGQTINFTLTTNVAGMLYSDTTNPGNVGMQFIPAWDTATTIHDVRILIVLLPNVTQDMVKTAQTQWDNILTDSETGRLTVYWQTSNLQPNEQYPVGVSFPAQYVQGGINPNPTGAGPSGPTIVPFTFPPQPRNNFLDYLPALIVGAVVITFIISALVAVSRRKRPYQAPTVGMETLGIRRGLTAVEASYILDLKPNQIVTEILYGLLQKRAVWVESAKPVLKLKIMPEYENKRGPDDNPLRYYEIDFLHAIKPDGTLSEEKLASAIMTLRDTLGQKLVSYSRKDTVDYYRKIVDKAWNQVQEAGTDELASKAYDEQLLWLLMDPNYRQRTETAFQTRVFTPSPVWFWYWYGYTHYYPNPVYAPNTVTGTQISSSPTQPNAPSPATPQAKPPSIPGADFANNIATSVEKTSNNIVANLEKFAAAILPPPPPPPKASHQPQHHGATCACACHNCACACACVSCACACAGGGVG